MSLAMLDDAEDKNRRFVFDLRPRLVLPLAGPLGAFLMGAIAFLSLR